MNNVVVIFGFYNRRDNIVSTCKFPIGKNISSNDDGSMSELFLNHIGGLQKYIPELLPLFAPNVNSFRRFLPDTSAPDASVRVTATVSSASVKFTSMVPR